jgi:hypothetical protein
MKQVVSASELGSPLMMGFDAIWRRLCGTTRYPPVDKLEYQLLVPYLDWLVLSERRNGRSIIKFCGRHIIRASGMDYQGFYLDELHLPGEPGTDWLKIHAEVSDTGIPIFGFSAQRMIDGSLMEHPISAYPCGPAGGPVDHIIGLEEWIGKDGRSSDLIEEAVAAEISPYLN